MITQTRLKELLRYDPETGLFIRNVARGNGGRFAAGSVAGSINKVNGYVEVSLDGRTYYAHRLAFFYVTGTLPAKGIDHRDLNRSNNAWANLREADQLRNTWNTPRQKSNTSGYKGVSRRRDTGRWAARLKHEGKYLSLGCFDTPEEAALAYQTAAQRYRGEFARA